MPSRDDHEATAGDVFDVSAVGSTVSAFAGTLPTPHAFTSVQPAFTSPDEQVSIDPSNDLLVVWVPDTIGGAEVTLEIDGFPGTVRCAAPDEAGQLTVPSQLLGGLNGAGVGAIVMTRSLRTTLQVGNASVTLESFWQVVGWGNFN
jgi:hypothetical protein